MSNYCPSCGDEVVPSLHSESCDYLIIEEFPELVLPAPAMMGKWQKDEFTPKKILVNELDKIGMVLQQFHVISVYPHLPPQDGIPNENCYTFGLEQATSLINLKKGIIILGGNLCKTFTGYDLKQVQGLSGVPSNYLSIRLNGGFLGYGELMFLPTLRAIYSTGAGEFSIGLQRFAKSVQQGEE
jgi:hypothetical protein